MESTSNYENRIGFSRAVRVRDIIAVSGTAPLLPNGKTASPGDAYAQTLRCFEIMADAVKDVGGDIADTVRTRIYLRQREDWTDAARAHAEFFMDVKPACTFVVVKGFIQDEWLVETELDCIVSEHQALL
ncbi:MAG: RidA family protein [Flavobacteriaceae bacterium]|nr:RidA family protein [Flavobacteriaceae bacterium]MDH3796714.1 RidA family protein [Flavobacteriaceae bacterium]